MRNKLIITVIAILALSFLLGCPNGTVDITDPTAGGSGALTADAFVVGGLTLSWEEAADDSSNTLQYRVVASTTESEVDTAAEVADLTDDEVLKDWASGFVSLDLTDLDPKTTYFINVAVKDTAGNLAAYDPIEITTLPAKMYLYSSSADTDGLLVNREGADNWVDSSSAQPSSVTETVAFLSISDTDEIRDIPTNYGFPTNVPIYGPDGIQKIADNWADLMDGTIDVDLETAGVFDESKSISWWSGSNSDGSISSDTCNGWTNADGTYSGTIGDGSSEDATWISKTLAVDSDYWYALVGLGY